MSLHTRLLMSLLGLTIIGLTIIGVGFAFLSQERQQDAVKEQLRTVLLMSSGTSVAAAARAGELPVPVRLAEATGTLRGPLSEAEHLWPPPQNELFLWRDRIYLAMVMKGVGNNADPRFLLASRPWSIQWRTTLNTLRSIFLLSVVVALIMVWLGIFFFRRTLLRPINALTALLAQGSIDVETDLMGLVPGGTDPLSQLGQAIISMQRRIGSDNERLLSQVQELQRTHAALQESQTQLLRSGRLAVVGQLAAGLAHEIGNPLAILTGYVEILKQDVGERLEGEAKRDAHDTIERMGKEVDRIHRTLRDLLDFSRVPANNAPGSVQTAMAHVQALLMPQKLVKHRALRLSFSTPEDLGAAGLPMVQLSTDDLTQLLMNLLLNAVHASPEGGRIEVRAQTDERLGGVRIYVDDQGSGVAEQDRAKIFQPFFTSKAPGEGTGLGLSVCERILNAVDGDIRVETSDLGGARFIVEVPIAPAQ